MESQIVGIQTLKERVNNRARMLSYSSPPPYVVHALLKLNQAHSNLEGKSASSQVSGSKGDFEKKANLLLDALNKNLEHASNDSRNRLYSYAEDLKGLLILLSCLALIPTAIITAFGLYERDYDAVFEWVFITEGWVAPAYVFIIGPFLLVYLIDKALDHLKNRDAYNHLKNYRLEIDRLKSQYGIIETPKKYVK